MTLSKTKLSLLISLGCVLVLGGSYAWFAWQSEDKTGVTDYAQRGDANSQTNIERNMVNVSGTDPHASSRDVLPSQGSTEDEAWALEMRARQARERVAVLSSDEVVRSLLGVYCCVKDDDTLNAAWSELKARGKKGDETAVQAIQSAIDEAPVKSQESLAHLLGEIATEDALRSLIDVLDTSDPNGRLRAAALDAIAEIGRYDDLKSSPQPLSSLLEDYFDTIPKNDLRAVESVASGMATLGTASGVEKILSFIEASESEGSLTPEHVDALGFALEKLDNPSMTLGVLQGRLLRDSKLERGVLSVMAGEAVTRMLGPSSTVGRLG